MHNLHLCVVRAASATEAENEVESYIAGWGDENNWRTICGSVSAKDEVHITGDGRYPPDADMTITKINKMFAGWVEHPEIGIMGIDLGPAIKEALQAVVDGHVFEQKEAFKLYTLERYIHDLYERAGNGLNAPGTIPNVFEHEYHNGDFDECGVTHCGDISDSELKDSEPPELKDRGDLYVVFVDMHS
jgi:hypothetical protein